MGVWRVRVAVVVGRFKSRGKVKVESGKERLRTKDSGHKTYDIRH